MSMTSKAVYFCLFVFGVTAPPPPLGQDLLIHEVSRSHTTTHHSRWDSPGRVISSSQKTLTDNTQHSQQKNIHASGGIRTHLSTGAAAHPHLRPRGHKPSITKAKFSNLIKYKTTNNTSRWSILQCKAYSLLNYRALM
jgi:hypothetical protein